jgi:hypothetical protein
MATNHAHSRPHSVSPANSRNRVGRWFEVRVGEGSHVREYVTVDEKYTYTDALDSAAKLYEHHMGLKPVVIIACDYVSAMDALEPHNVSEKTDG